MKIDYGKKGYKIAIFALVMALLAFSVGSGINNNYYNNSTNGSNFTFNGTLTYGLSELNMTNGLHYFYNNTYIFEHTPGSSFGIATNLDMEGNDIINCANCLSLDSGTYTGDGTTNRFIPYNFNRTAAKIDIMNNNSAIVGAIIQPGSIISNTAIRTIVTPHNTTGFFVGGMWNVLSGINMSEIGGTSSHETGIVGNIRWFPFIPATTGEIINISINNLVGLGGARIALYSDSLNLPDQLLNETGSLSISNGFTTIQFIHPVTQGERYWVASQYNNSGTDAYFTTTGTMYYKSQAYGSFPPSTSGLSSLGKTYNYRINVSSVSSEYYWVAI